MGSPIDYEFDGCHDSQIGIAIFWPSFGLSPFPVIVANEGLWESPTEHEIIMVVTITGRGNNPSHHKAATRNLSPQVSKSFGHPSIAASNPAKGNPPSVT